MVRNLRLFIKHIFVRKPPSPVADRAWSSYIHNASRYGGRRA